MGIEDNIDERTLEERQVDIPGIETLFESVEPFAEGTDIDSVLVERGGRYGTFENQSDISQKLQELLFINNKYKLSRSQIEALQMISGKLSRIVNGDPNYADSWIDVAGYAMLIANELEGHNK